MVIDNGPFHSQNARLDNELYGHPEDEKGTGGCEG